MIISIGKMEIIQKMYNDILIDNSNENFITFSQEGGFSIDPHVIKIERDKLRELVTSIQAIIVQDSLNNE